MTTRIVIAPDLYPPRRLAGNGARVPPNGGACHTICEIRVGRTQLNVAGKPGNQ